MLPLRPWARLPKTRDGVNMWPSTSRVFIDSSGILLRSTQHLSAAGVVDSMSPPLALFCPWAFVCVLALRGVFREGIIRGFLVSEFNNYVVCKLNEAC